MNPIVGFGMLTPLAGRMIVFPALFPASNQLAMQESPPGPVFDSYSAFSVGLLVWGLPKPPNAPVSQILTLAPLVFRPDAGSGPAQFLHRPARVPDLRHVADFVAIEVH
jgi:hypothetical protein